MMKRPNPHRYSGRDDYEEALNKYDAWLQEQESYMKQKKKRTIKLIIGGVVTGFACIMMLITLMLSWYTVEEGHVGIVKRFSEAKTQVNPGLHFKVPFADSVEVIEVRTRKASEQMASATSEQMPVTVATSLNWTVDKEAALSMFQRYGGLAQFEDRILDPRLRSATKAVIPKFSAEQLIQDRNTAIMQIESLLRDEMEGFPVAIDNIQIENITLPQKYLTSIETKQTEKNLADAEKHKLAKQKLVAMQEVNIAEAKAQSVRLVAQAEADARLMAGEAKAKVIQLEGLAEAEAIEAKAKALRDNPLIIDLTEAQNWNGSLPSTIMGEGMMPILDMRK